MAGSLNKVALIGHVGKDPETRSFANGGKVTNFSLATSESWVKDGERRDKTQWHSVVVKNEKLAEIVERYVTKGSKLYVEGAIETRKYQAQDGSERQVTEVVVGPFRGEIVLLGGKADGEGRSAPVERQPVPAGVLEDEIPF